MEYRCSVSCNPDDPRACRDVAGLCARVRNGAHACVGDVESGEDTDDAVLHVGTQIAARLQPDDVDVFRLALPAGRWHVAATPGAGVDLALDFYDARARLVGAFDDSLAGGAEATPWIVRDNAGGFVVVRHVAGQGAYTLEVAHE